MTAAACAEIGRAGEPATGGDSADPVFDPRLLRHAFGRFATGVTVITTRAPDGRPVGMTASSFNTVSLDPPLILWSIRLTAPSLAAFRANSHFAVNVLAADQEDVCARFARPAEDKFEGLAHRPGLGGAPILDGALTRLQCRVWARYPGGDHEIFVGRVLDVETTEGDPLVFHGGALHHLAPTGPVA